MNPAHGRATKWLVVSGVLTVLGLVDLFHHEVGTAVITLALSVAAMGRHEHWASIANDNANDSEDDDDTNQVHPQ